jgi:cytochrome c-type biogenesis protein CcmH
MILAMAVLAGLMSAAPPDAKALEREAKQIEALVIAPCCWSQPVAVHYSAEADAVRAEIRRRLSDGQSRRQILDAFVAQYGTRILADPPVRGLRWLPWAFLLAGGVLTVIVIRHLRANREAGVADEAPPTSARDDRYAERLDRELRELD